MRGEEQTFGAREQAEVACTAALGYQTRAAEFEKLGEDSRNPALTSMLNDAFRASSFGDGWFSNVCGTAGTLMNASEQAPFDPDVAELLAPVGVGHHMRDQMLADLVGRLFVTPGGQERDLGDLGPLDLAHCWRYCYYLHACEQSLPAAAGGLGVT
jgi:hypothetical protein